MRTSNRNIDYLKQAMFQINTDIQIVEEAIQRVGKPKEIDSFFDKFTIAFGKWLLVKAERTLDHSVEDLLQMYREEQSCAEDHEQIE